MANLYLREDLADVSVGAQITLDGAEARHVVSVSRTRVGEQISVTNGRGMLVNGVVTATEPSRVVITIDAVDRSRAATPRIVLVQALAKGDRDELALQASVELGVHEIVPWQAARSVSRWSGDKLSKGVQRWSTIAREATKQSMRSWMPSVTALVTTAELARRASACRMLVLEPGAQTRLTGIDLDPDDHTDIVLVVGPEGGVAPEESARLREAGAVSVRLGDSVLRTSSAGPAAIAVLNVALERW